MDVLSDVIAAMRTGRPHSSRSVRYAPWGVRFPASKGAGFHVVLQGSAWLLTDDAAPRRLGPGDVVFLAHGYGHGLADDPATPLREFTVRPDGTWPPVPDPGRSHGRPANLLLCGAYQLSRARAHPLLADLPDVIHLPARVGEYASVRAVVDLLGAELANPGCGSDAIVPALLDTLLVYLLRTWWLRERADDPTGWAGALGDPAVTAALQAIHRDPAHPWTVEGLGAEAGLSRAAFARRFTALTGQPPLAYLTWWRMTTAGRLLREDDAPLRSVAERSGYTSEFAFAKAFKREYGMAPGQYRSRA
ncbi:AraC family transcriptional regulator [Streptomyces sp. WAC05374]|uniref:AraC family transcriptional regulator n=1 Tax=Streptomyces sp. WAC05374 TaxID=2487420 RepID=UPI000F88AA2A|nr:AraC family transcriptional regulator [Streptomyces sp. WAC05374]RST14140.1 AraC family transcriptional regulator [Streptomyces sp. WAC05374]TDF48722.1 AraC family transcriptional regulator [Streptomyces sp. WAC05374]TDF49324.1 AraC family transcriptional regulator [Streptomyces sp. WAC05374]TDF55549.1 AraC family transcriptional regulator [Streptomyces sp. WAC05374]